MNRPFAMSLKRALKTPALILSFLAVLILFGATRVWAGGRPVGKHRLFVMATSSYFFNNQYWDENGQTKSYDNNGKYSTFSLSLSAEYGFSRRVSLMLSVPYTVNFFKNNVNSTTVGSLGDASVGMSYYIANIAYRTYFSVQTNFLFPVYHNTDSLNHGYGDVGANVQFLASGDFKIGEKSFAFAGQVGASQYFGPLAPLQLSFSGTLGFSVSKKSQLSLTETTASSYSPSKAFNPASPVPAKDFTYSEVTVTVAHNITRNKSFFFSGTRFLFGKNTGIGNTLTLGYAYKF